MIEINLLPEELKKKEMVRFALPENFNRQALFVFVVVFVSAQILLYGLAMYQGGEFLRVRKEVASLTQQNKEVAAHKSEVVLMKARLKEINSLTQRKFFWCTLVNTLSDSIAKGVWLRRFSIMEEERKVMAPPKNKPSSKETKGVSTTQKVRVLKLEGSVVGASGQETDYVVKFAKELKANPWFSSLFSEIELFNINQRKIKTFDVYDFMLECVFKKEKF